MPSRIEYVDESLNIVPGCKKVSAGCKNCFAERMAKRLSAMGQEAYIGLTDENGWTGKVRFLGERLNTPERWRKPRRIFLNTMGDTFHEGLDDTHIYMMLQMVVDNPAHTFIVVTKRAQRALQYINYFCYSTRKDQAIPNLWLLVSIEDQKTADGRIPYLLGANVVVRGLSMEPLLGDVNLGFAGIVSKDISPRYTSVGELINWVIVGGESGPNARPMHPDWARSVRNQCVDAEIPFFFKQWGAWLHVHPKRKAYQYSEPAFRNQIIGDVRFVRLGKKKAGRILDGRTWDEYPDAE